MRDYTIGVTVVRLSEKKEKELNVFLNNQYAQGFFEKDTLFELLESAEISLDGIGLTKLDLELDFGELPDLLGQSQIKEQEESANRVATDVAAIKARKKAAKEEARQSPDNDADYYLLVAFDSTSDKERFLNQIGSKPDIRYLSADFLYGLLKPEHQWIRDN